MVSTTIIAALYHECQFELNCCERQLKYMMASRKSKCWATKALEESNFMFIVSIYIFVIVKLRSNAKTIFILKVDGISKRFWQLQFVLWNFSDNCVFWFWWVTCFCNFLWNISKMFFSDLGICWNYICLVSVSLCVYESLCV